MVSKENFPSIIPRKYHAYQWSILCFVIFESQCLQYSLLFYHLSLSLSFLKAGGGR